MFNGVSDAAMNGLANKKNRGFVPSANLPTGTDLERNADLDLLEKLLATYTAKG